MVIRHLKLPATAAALPRKVLARARVWWKRLKRIVTPRHALLAGAGVVVLLAALFFWPRTVQFSFAKDNCFFNPMLLPHLAAKDQGRTFAATPKKNYCRRRVPPLFAHHLRRPHPGAGRKQY